MASYSVAEAKNRLSALIDAAERGEPVTITRYGKPVVELKAVGAPSDKRVTPESIDWIERELADMPPMTVDSGTFVRRMRDEEDER